MGKINLSNLSFVDVETTGTSGISDRIIDIGIVRVENGKKIVEFETLVNPQTYVSPYISQMTGITPEMLYSAPTFDEIKSKVYELLENSLFIAHNVQFDYSFVKNEFTRYETKFNSKMLCTVRLSRLLYPHEHHHNLDAIINRFEIPVDKRHRALPDAKAMFHFWNLAKNTLSEEIFTKAVKTLTKKSRLPHALNSDSVKNIPNLPGVYIFYDKDGVCLYIGKSTNLKDRISSHFSSFHTTYTDQKLASTVADIEIKRTGGDLSASLMEADLIKKLQPIFNKKLRYMKEVTAAIKIETSDYHSVRLEKIKLPIKSDFRSILSIYPSQKKARDELYEICKNNSICPKKIGLEKSSGSCFNYQIGKCEGACIGKESALIHNIKLIEAFKEFLVPKWPFDGEILIEEISGDLKEAVHVNNWMHTGTTMLKEGEVVFKPKESAIYIDTVKILKSFLINKNYFRKAVTRNINS